MTTAELIKQLQAADPAGTTEVAIDNLDVHFVECLEAYWDGLLQRVIRDESRQDYNVVGARVTAKGRKVRIHTIGVKDAIANDPDLPVDLSEVGELRRADWQARVDGWRAEARKLIRGEL